MIHFSSVVPHKNAYLLPCGRAAIGVFAPGLEYRSFEKKLIDVVNCNLDRSLRTPAEERVIDSFWRWVESVQHKTWTMDITNSVFFYSNCHTGRQIAFIAWCGYDDFGAVTL